METKEYAAMTDRELAEEAKKLKSFSITNALIIGAFAGILLFSIIKSTWGMLSLIPLFFIYKMINDPRNKKAKEVESILNQRNSQ